jgi:hypothetical protein
MLAAPRTLPSWYRALAIVVGVISIGLALLVLVDPALGLALLVILLAFALLVIGFDRLIMGVTGHTFGAGALLPMEFTGKPGAPPQSPPGGGLPPSP